MDPSGEQQTTRAASGQSARTQPQMPSLHIPSMECQMQRDTHLTFTELHEDYPALMRSIKETQRHEVDVTSYRTLPDLRFICVPSAEYYTRCLERGQQVDVRVTNKGECSDLRDCVTVSYCWDTSLSGHDSNLEFGDGHIPHPGFSVITSTSVGETRREPRCPPVVLHRAIRFALAKDMPFVWIDQECIDQEDSNDVATHLRSMHTIYGSSRFTIGLLSFSIKDATQFDELKQLLSEFLQARPPSLEILVKASSFLQCIAGDMYCCRTWTFLERLSAHTLFLLLPYPCWRQRPMINGLNFMTIPGEFVLWPYIFVVHVKSWKGRYKLSLHDRLWALDSLEEVLKTVYIIAAREHSIAVSFEQMERCENRVISDRLAIFADVCDFKKRLDTTKLNDKAYSYSTCVLAMLLSDERVPKIPIRIGTQFLQFPVIPLDVTVSQLVDAMYHSRLTIGGRNLGHQVLKYGIKTGQLPADAIYISWRTDRLPIWDWLWKESFIRTHFI